MKIIDKPLLGSTLFPEGLQIGFHVPQTMTASLQLWASAQSLVQFKTEFL